ncbi:MAG TPA: ABC transporter permease [Marmoricola sp.]|nr:ABC transporter permease [Marmoricola sp.]
MKGTRPGTVEAIRLVAGREVVMRLRSKAYRIITLVMVGLVVGFALVMQVVTGHHSADRVGLVPATRQLAPAVAAAAAGAGQQVRTVVVTDVAAGRRQVAAGRLDALVSGLEGDRLQVVVRESLDTGLQATLTRAVAQTALDRQISRLGGDPAQVARAVAQARVHTQALQPPQSFDPQRLAVGSVAGILVYFALVGTGQGVATGVVEEKSSRVVELLLATIRPWQLMAGKVVGIGLMGLLQVVIVGVAGVLAGELSGALHLSLGTSVGVVAWLVVWFVLGFTIYSLVFAGLGALVSRQEEVAGATAPATTFLVVGYVVGITVLPSSPDNTLVAILSLLPVFSPTLMPMRLAMGAVPVWQTLLSLLLAVATIPLLVVLAGRLYRNGVVRTGAKVSLRAALRG